MRALNRYADKLRDKAIADAVRATDNANANPTSVRAQQVANLYVGIAQAARTIADDLRYNRRSY